ncbi:MAG TPA: hypothetical protein VGB78_08825 [Thermoplasmata archaeon]
MKDYKDVVADPNWLIRFFEDIFPTPPGNYFIVFRRRESEAK